MGTSKMRWNGTDIIIKKMLAQCIPLIPKNLWPINLVHMYAPTADKSEDDVSSVKHNFKMEIDDFN